MPDEENKERETIPAESLYQETEDDEISELEHVQRLQQAENILREFRHSFSGPLPPPDLLREYDALVPGTAKQMIDDVQKRALKEQEHRHSLEVQGIEQEGLRVRAATLIAFLMLLATVICAYINPWTAAAPVSIGVVAAIIAILGQKVDLRSMVGSSRKLSRELEANPAEERL